MHVNAYPELLEDGMNARLSSDIGNNLQLNEVIQYIVMKYHIHVAGKFGGLNPLAFRIRIYMHGDSIKFVSISAKAICDHPHQYFRLYGIACISNLKYTPCVHPQGFPMDLKFCSYLSKILPTNADSNMIKEIVANIGCSFQELVARLKDTVVDSQFGLCAGNRCVHVVGLTLSSLILVGS
jgi:hypothetical protein